MRETHTMFRSRTVLAPAGARLYAVGDIHGRKDLLDRLLEAILRDAARSRAGRRVVVFLGDYIDRGPDSKEVVEMLRNGPPGSPRWSGFQWVCLRGNHEQALLNFLDDPLSGPMWLANGGMEAILSYAGQPIDRGDLDGLQAQLRAAFPPSHRAFLSSLPYSHCEGDYFFAHAGIRPGVPLGRQDPMDLMWIRGEFLKSRADHGKLVIHGHTVSARPEILANRIGIDTGAFRSGQLTALVAEGAERGFLST